MRLCYNVYVDFDANISLAGEGMYIFPEKIFVIIYVVLF